MPNFKKFLFLSLLIFNGYISCVEARKPKIALVSLYDPAYKKIGQYSDDNKKRYCENHGYDLIFYHEKLDHTRPAPWSKIIALLKHLKDYDWLYWSDADSLIMNPKIKLESFIDNKFNLIISRDAYGLLNTGSFLIKNSEWSFKLLNDIYAQTAYINKTGFWEQEGLAAVLRANPKLMYKIKVLPPRALNSNILAFNQEAIYQPGDFVIHFYTPCNKEMLMKQWSNRIKYE